MQEPEEQHMKAIKKVLRYVKGTKDYGITYKHNGVTKHGYSDSSYGVNTQEGKGTTGIIFYYGESPRHWSTQKQATVALSSCESEFIAATAAATQALWLKRLLSKLTHSDEEKITILVDNKSAIALMKNPVFHGRSKHIDTKYHFIRECVERDDIQWRERFMNYLEEQTDGEAMINSIQNGDHPLHVIAQVSLAGNTQNAPPTLKDPKFWTAEEKKTQKIDRLARSLLIQRLPNDIYSLIDSNETAKDLWDAHERQMRGYEYGEQYRKAAILYEYETFKATEGEQLLDTYLLDLQVINDLKKCGYKKDTCDVNEALGYKKKAIVITSDPLALVAEKTKITALLAKAFNRRKFYSKPTDNNLRTSSTSQSANKKQEFVKSDDKKVEKKNDEKKRDMIKVNCYNCKKEGHFAKDCKKAKVKDYNYYKTKMLLAKKDSDEQVLLAEDQAWMKFSSDSDQEINANMVFMA
nr:zinc finger, CCHC-type [Tanacetum cinerariifolium]